MQSSPPSHIDGKARAIRELSASLNHSSRSISPAVSAPSESNPTKRSGFSGAGTLDDFFNDDPLMSTQHNLGEDTNTLPQHPHIRTTAKKVNTWHMLRSEQPNPDTSMVKKEFGDFDHSVSDDEDMSIEQARGHRSNRSTPVKMSSRQFDSLYDITPPTGRSRKSYGAETGSLRRDAQIRRASRNDLDMNASPRPASARISPAMASTQDRKRASLAQLHAKVSEDESSILGERPPAATFKQDRGTRWGNTRSRQTSLQVDGAVDTSPRIHATPRSRPATANATAQSFVLPDLPNLTELVSGVFQDGTPVFSKNVLTRSRLTGPNNGGAGRRQPSHTPLDSVPIPQDEKAIFAGLQLLQDKVAQMEHERAEADKKMEEQELEIIELRAAAQAQEKLRRSDSALGSTDGEGSGKNSWKVEKTRLDATMHTLRTKLDRTERKIAVVEIEKKRLSTERDNMASQLGVAFQTCEELKVEREVLRRDNDLLRREVDRLRADNDALQSQLEEEQVYHREETLQLRRQVDQTEDATQKQNFTLQAELERVQAQQDEQTQQLARNEVEVRKARQLQSEHAKLQADNEALKSQLTSVKAKREEDARRAASQQAAMKARVERRDDTIRHFQDQTQEQTNQAMRSDNEHLREELAQLTAQHEEDVLRWSQKETQLKQKAAKSDGVARHLAEVTQDLMNVGRAQAQQTGGQPFSSADKENVFEEPGQRKSSHHREENTRTRIRNRVQEEVRNSRANSSFQSSHILESPRKSKIRITRTAQREPLPTNFGRSVSSPVAQSRHVEVESDIDSTTNLSLAPRGTPYVTRSGTIRKQPTIQSPPDLDLTELSYINKDQIAGLRRQLEIERAAERGRAASAPFERAVREDTIRTNDQAHDNTFRSARQAPEDTVRSVASVKSNRPTARPRKSSMKDMTTTKTNVTQFEEDSTNDISNAEDVEDLDTKQPTIDLSMLSNTSRRRRSAPTEMTSAFIVPDLKIESRKEATLKMDLNQKITSKQHDNENCTVCRRQAADASAGPLSVPKLIPVSSRTPDDVDATLRPARSPKEALAIVVKELRDERCHLHIELACHRAWLEAYDPSLGRRNRVALENAISELLAKIKLKDDQIYNLYDVLEGQKEGDITEQYVDDVTEQIRAEDEQVEKKGKKVTIQSFHEDEESARLSMDEELPWEGFEDTGERDFTTGSRVGVY